MSECVVQMEMPENCEACHLRVNNSLTNVPDWICAVNQWPTFYCRKSQNHANEDKYLHDCPIIYQLPEGHGRLVDTDSVGLAMVRKGQRSSRYKLGEMWELNGLEIQEALQTVSTIVPAERSEA